jgi:hypothetical protein
MTAAAVSHKNGYAAGDILFLLSEINTQYRMKYT